MTVIERRCAVKLSSVLTVTASTGVLSGEVDVKFIEVDSAWSVL